MPHNRTRKKPIPEVRLSPAVIASPYTQENQALFQTLRNHRMELAKEQGIPAYMIFSDAVLHLLATHKPIDMEHFGQILGIGEFKKKKYGESFINIIQQFL